MDVVFRPMYRGTHPTSGADHQPSLPPAAMLVDMHRLPTIPARPASQPFTSYTPYQRTSVATSRPEVMPPSQHHRPRDPDSRESNAQQLPSLRTLLEPGLLDTKLPDTLPRAAASTVSLAHGRAVRYESSSPILKRRHDFEGYSHELSEGNSIACLAPPGHRHAHTVTSVTDVQPLTTFSTPGSIPASSLQSDHTRHGGLARLPQHDPVGTLSIQQLHDDPMDIVKAPIRRRTEGTSRAPIRASRCVGQREIPGEGLCYVYEDGTYCRAVIDGEPVNPSWGITKAGKPRKRLAQACLTCREKKIKCEPGYPKCHQCAKSQRSCRG